MLERVLTQSPDLGSSKEKKSKKDLKFTKKKQNNRAIFLFCFEQLTLVNFLFVFSQQQDLFVLPHFFRKLWKLSGRTHEIFSKMDQERTKEQG